MARAHKCQSQNSYGLITYPFSLIHLLSVSTRGIQRREAFRDARHRVSTVKITDNAVVVEWCHPSKY